MKQILTLIFALSTLAIFAQIPTWDEWEKQAKTNKKLLPEYGHQIKTEAEIDADEKFISSIMAMDQFEGDRHAASNHLIQLGFNYLYMQDLFTAMSRFNQAYLLDSTNSDIYWGYGAVYMTLGNFELGKQQYEAGLIIDSVNTHLLTDLSTYYMEQYLAFIAMPENEYVKNPKELAAQSIDSALYCLNKSYKIDPRNENTVYKLSTVCYYAGDCENAWKYYDECRALGGRPITDEYTKDLKKKCKKN